MKSQDKYTSPKPYLTGYGKVTEKLTVTEEGRRAALKEQSLAIFTARNTTSHAVIILDWGELMTYNGPLPDAGPTPATTFVGEILGNPSTRLSYKRSPLTLQTACSQYGRVIDTFIPNRKAISGKRFGIVRFTKTFDADRLVNNLCTIWIGRSKLHANIARFNRPPLKNIKIGHQSHYVEKESKPAIVLDDSCGNQRDFATVLMGKVKEFSSPTNLRLVAKEKFKANVVICSWFSQLQQASNDFLIDERVTWVDIEGVPLKVWSKITFNRIASKWGDFLHIEDQEDDVFHSKRICVKTKIVKNIFESFKIISKGCVFWIRAKEVSGWTSEFAKENEDDSDTDGDTGDEVLHDDNEGIHKDTIVNEDRDIEEVVETIFEKESSPVHMKDTSNDDHIDSRSEDPFNIYIYIYIYKLLQKKNDNIAEGSNFNDSFKYPLDFTPTTASENQPNACKESVVANEEHLQRPKKIGLRSYASIIRYSASVGNSGGILCIWNSSMFCNTNSTVFDYFVLINREWVPSGKKLLIISVYAPQELNEKKMLWDYLILVINNWNCEVIIMGNFNEVQKQTKRFGSKFNVHGADAFNLFISTAGFEEVPLGGCGNSSFIALILKTTDAKMVKDFRPITLIGSLYKIIAKILANRLVVVLGDIVNKVQSAFVANRQILDGPFILNEIFQWCKKKRKHSMIFKVDFEKAYDSVRWDYLDGVLKNFGYGDRVVDAGLFRGVSIGSSLHIFYADDIVFLGHWSDSNIDIIGISVSSDIVDQTASKIGCATLKPHFSYLGSKVDGLMSRIQSWDEIMNTHAARLSKWKIKTLSIRVKKLKNLGTDLLSLIHKKLGNGTVTSFWEDVWRGDATLKSLYPILFALDSSKSITIAMKLSQDSLCYSFRRAIRGGVEQAPVDHEHGRVIDDCSLPVVSSKTKWVNVVPIKVNTHAWKVRLDGLPTRLNISKRGMNIESIPCPLCDNAMESSSQIFFACHIARELFRKITQCRDRVVKQSCEAVKRIFRYFKGTMHLGLWYPKGSGIETIVYADSDHAGDYVDRKSTSGVCTFMGCCLTSWFSKKQTALAISTTEAEYVSAEMACQQAL
nr:RNA-directed DNA polymerase, eukaryota, nucleotide-binding alpha-beta plait domain protein [Tanacetum cinerariifolium]